MLSPSPSRTKQNRIQADMDETGYTATLGELNAPGPDGFSRQTTATPTRQLSIRDGNGLTVFTARTADTPEAADRHIRSAGFQRTSDWLDGACSVNRIPATTLRRKRILVFGSVVAALIVVIGGCSALNAARQSKPTPTATSTYVPPFTASGTLTIESTTSIKRNLHNVYDRSNDNCSPMGGYEDLALDTAVEITGNNGKVVAVGRIKSGKQSPEPKNCVLSWAVDNVPSGQLIYTISFGHRSPVTLTEQELRSGYEGSIGSGS